MRIIVLFSGLVMAASLGAQIEPPAPRRAFEGNGLLKLLEVAPPGQQGPQTQRERFMSYVRRTVGPVPLLVEATTAAYDQGWDRPQEWGQESGGYAKRFANAIAYNGVRQTITYGMSLWTHEDTRYFPSDRDGVWGRTVYALRSTLTARHNGRVVFSISAMTGAVGAAAISRAWVPDSWQHPKNVAASVGLTLAGMAGFNVAREFLLRR